MDHSTFQHHEGTDTFMYNPPASLVQTTAKRSMKNDAVILFVLNFKQNLLSCIAKS